MQAGRWPTEAAVSDLAHHHWKLNFHSAQSSAKLFVPSVPANPDWADDDIGAEESARLPERRRDVVDWR